MAPPPIIADKRVASLECGLQGYQLRSANRRRAVFPKLHTNWSADLSDIFRRQNDNSDSTQPYFLL